VNHEVDADWNVRNYKVEDKGQGDMTFHEVDEYGKVHTYHVEDGGEGDRYYHKVDGDVILIFERLHFCSIVRFNITFVFIFAYPDIGYRN
jgi:hypothetical protein